MGPRRKRLPKLNILHARLNRALSRGTFMGITGSSGKSTAAALLSHILSGSASVQDQIGWNTPKALLTTMTKLRHRTEFVVVEVGAGVGHVRWRGCWSPISRSSR
jgi:UDP-N-acetylmuramoyl-tripeptide--D-alanyl-D-alanine ligase